MPLVTTARQTPVGVKLGDGYRSLIAFEADPDVSFWEKTVRPPGYDGGDAVDNTTMHNNTVRTKAPRALIDTTDGATRVAYDPRVIDQILALINVETCITYHYPDGSCQNIFGYLRSFTPGELAEGAQPEADIVIVHTNVDPNTGSESVPEWIQAGTGT